MTWYERRGSKYGAKTTTYNGILYHSKKEAGYAQGLDLLVKSGEINGWERQVKISLDVNGKHICNYFIDFVITHKDGTLEYVEIKGFETDTWKLKWKLFEAIYGHDPMTKLTVIK